MKDQWCETLKTSIQMNQLNQHSSLLSVRFKTIIVTSSSFLTLHRFQDKRWNALMVTSILGSPLIDFVLFRSFQRLPLGVPSLLLVQCMTVAMLQIQNRLTKLTR